MYAIVETGGKQVRVRPQDELYVEKLPHPPGEVVVLDRVLLYHDGERVRVGTPYLEGVAVVARVLSVERGEKILVFHKRRRKRYKKMQGHRQWLSKIRIEEVRVNHGS
jgi:large subunit ribosomal protein L21